MVVLVTGATGFLGSRLAARLAAQGVTVRALVRRASDRRRLAGLELEWAEGDVTDRASVDAAMAGVDLVVHSAALYELGTPDAARMRAINVGGTANVLEAAAARGARAVHVSSVAALGPTGAAPVDETHWAGDAPRSAYEATKREAHEVARRLARAGAAVRIALPVTIYGPDDPSLTGRLHAWFLAGLVPVGALGETTMSLVHVDDCADGLCRVAEAGRDGEEYILCGQAVTVRVWLDTLARAAGRRRPGLYLPGWLVRAVAPAAALAAPLAGLRPDVVREGMAMAFGAHWSFSGDKARRELGFVPRPLEDGLRDVARWHHERAG